MAPEVLEGLRPVVERSDRLDVGAIKDPASLSSRVHQAYVVEHLEVLRDGRLTQAQRGDDIADRSFAGREVDKDVAAARFSDSVEDIRRRGGSRQGRIVFPLRNMSTPAEFPSKTGTLLTFRARI